MSRAFYDLDPDDKAPESLKKALVSEIDTMRGTMEVVTLFVGNFFNAAGQMFGNKPKDSLNTNSKPE